MISTKNAAAMSAIAAFCCGVAVEAAMATVSPSWAEMTKSRRALIEDVLAQERAFAKDTVRRGMREAFLTYIADDGVLFAPGPVSGKKHLSAAELGPGTLTWAPAFAGMAVSGDLAFTVGPYVWTDGKVRSAGQYLTIWRKDLEGRWRFALDRGTGGPREHEARIDGVQVVRLPMSDTKDDPVRGSRGSRGGRSFAEQAEQVGRFAGLAHSPRARRAGASAGCSARHLRCRTCRHCCMGACFDHLHIDCREDLGRWRSRLCLWRCSLDQGRKAAPGPLRPGLAEKRRQVDHRR